MTRDILSDLADLHAQATRERSHYYVGRCVGDAIAEIRTLRADLDKCKEIIVKITTWFLEETPKIKKSSLLLLLSLLLLSGCVDSDPWLGTPLDDEPWVRELRSQVAAYYEVPELTAVRHIWLVEPWQTDGFCRTYHSMGCNAVGTIILSGILSPPSLCATLAHELNHSAAFQLRGDWDFGHDFHPEFYTSVIYELCNAAPPQEGTL
jgi:hypothetical protein